MALLRIMHAADMPDPGSLVKTLEELVTRAPAGLAAPGVVGSSGASGSSVPQAFVPPGPRWEALVEQVEHAHQHTGSIMRMQVRIVELAPGLLRYAQPPGFNQDIAGMMRDALQESTGERWQVERVEGEGAPTLFEQAEARKAADALAVRNSPLVAATLAAFPGAELIEDDRPAMIGGGSRNWRR